jgi:hypothetical protein
VNYVATSSAGGGAGPQPLSLAVGDFNNDGNPDIVVDATGAQGAYVPRVFLGLGDGTFQTPPIDSNVPDFNSSALAVAADFNSDGDIDVAQSGSLDLGDGKGSLSAEAVINVGSLSTTTALVTADLNKDGFPDLIEWSDIGNSNDVITVLLNCGLRCTNTTVASSTTSSVFNQPVTFAATVTPANAKATGAPTGTVTFQAATPPQFPTSTITLGSAALSGGVATLSYASLTPGQQYAITAIYKGDSNFDLSTSATQPTPAASVTVQPGSTTTMLVSSVDPSSPGESVTFTATVAAVAPSSGVPTGTVTFSDNGNALVAQPLDSTGTATFSTSALTAGTHSITASYYGGLDFESGALPTLTQIVGADAAPFSVSVTPTSATVSAGGSADFTVTAATVPSLKGTISLLCTGLPTGASCNFSPPQITPQGASATATLRISTTGSGSVFDRPFALRQRPNPAIPFVLLGLIVFVILVATRKQQTKESVFAGFVLACVFVSLTVVASCGGGGSHSVTPAGTSQVTVMASSSGYSQTTNISLTVN